MCMSTLTCVEISCSNFVARVTPPLQFSVIVLFQLLQQLQFLLQLTFHNCWILQFYAMQYTHALPNPHCYIEIQWNKGIQTGINT